jgi:hypothetical protein
MKAFNHFSQIFAASASILCTLAHAEAAIVVGGPVSVRPDVKTVMKPLPDLNKGDRVHIIKFPDATAGEKLALVKLPYCAPSSKCPPTEVGRIQTTQLAFEKDFLPVQNWAGTNVVLYCYGDYCPELNIAKNGSVEVRFKPECKERGIPCTESMQKLCAHYDQARGNYCVSSMQLYSYKGVYWIKGKNSKFSNDLLYLEQRRGLLCPADLLAISEECHAG